MDRFLIIPFSLTLKIFLPSFAFRAAARSRQSEPGAAEIAAAAQIPFLGTCSRVSESA